MQASLPTEKTLRGVFTGSPVRPALQGIRPFSIWGQFNLQWPALSAEGASPLLATPLLNESRPSTVMTRFAPPLSRTALRALPALLCSYNGGGCQGFVCMAFPPGIRRRALYTVRDEPKKTGSLQGFPFFTTAAESARLRRTHQPFRADRTRSRISSTEPTPATRT